LIAFEGQIEVAVDDWGSVIDELTLGAFPGDTLLHIRKENESDPPFSVMIESSASSAYDPFPWEQRSD